MTTRIILKYVACERVIILTYQHSNNNSNILLLQYRYTYVYLTLTLTLRYKLHRPKWQSNIATSFYDVAKTLIINLTTSRLLPQGLTSGSAGLILTTTADHSRFKTAQILITTKNLCNSAFEWSDRKLNRMMVECLGFDVVFRKNYHFLSL